MASVPEGPRGGLRETGKNCLCVNFAAGIFHCNCVTENESGLRLNRAEKFDVNGKLCSAAISKLFAS